MRFRPARPLAAACLCLLLFARERAHAGCPAVTPAQARDQHTLVFLGTVEAVKDSTVKPASNPKGLSGTWRIARVRISSIWKGSPRREIFIVSQLAPDVPKLALGETYVVYADSVAKGCVFDRCSRTRPYAQAGEDLKALGTPTIVQRIPARKPASPK
jgi:hypothetical protein